MNIYKQVKLYKFKEAVPVSGKYICVICGLVQEFTEGQVFGVCGDCLAGEVDGPVLADEGYWKLME